MADKILSSAEAIVKSKDKKRHLLLGNGFSVEFRARHIQLQIHDREIETSVTEASACNLFEHQELRHLRF